MSFIHFCEITHEKNINHTHAHTWTSIKTDKGISEINQPWGAILVQSSQTLHYIFFYHHHVSMSLSPYHLCHDALTLTSWSKNLPGQTISGQFVEPDWSSSQTFPWALVQALEGQSASRQEKHSLWYAPCQSVSRWGGRAVTFVVSCSDRCPICCRCSLSPRWRASSASACRAYPFLGEDSSSCQENKCQCSVTYRV